MGGCAWERSTWALGVPSEKLEVVLTDQAYIGKHREELKAKYRELFELK